MNNTTGMISSACAKDEGKACWAIGDSPLLRDPIRLNCPLGKIGDRLWVRESFGSRVIRDASGGTGEFTTYRASNPDAVYCTSTSGETIPIKWKPSTQMPRSASRILLEITGVRVEHLQDISEDDAIAEGIIAGRYGNEGNWLNGFYVPGNNQPYQTAKAAYAELWRSIHGVDSWYMNSWVWVVEFKRVAS